jgi:hypothetical protein
MGLIPKVAVAAYCRAIGADLATAAVVADLVSSRDDMPETIIELLPIIEQILSEQGAV